MGVGETTEFVIHYSHVSPTPTAARALCSSSAISWIELVRSTLLALASPANFLASCPSARLRYDSVLQRCFHVKNVSPLRKFVSPSTSRVVDHVRKWTRLSLRFSGGSKVIRRLLRGRREKPGDEARYTALSGPFKRVQIKYNIHIMIQVFGHSVTYIFPFMFMLLLFLFVSSGFPATDLFMSHIETTETLKTMRKSFETCLMWFRTTDSLSHVRPLELTLVSTKSIDNYLRCKLNLSTL